MLTLDVELDAPAVARMNAIAPQHWFAQVQFRNVASPRHPHLGIADLDSVKAELLSGWLPAAVGGRSVLDLFCANGAFSVRSLQAGARSVVGVDAESGRLAAARFVLSHVSGGDRVRLVEAEVLDALAGMTDRFDVVLCLGGLYHMADPALLLERIRAVTAEQLILQTSHVVRWPGNWARFVIRRHEDAGADLPSIRPGRGAWHCTRSCLRALLAHAGFEVVEEQGPLRPARGRPLWYLARCVPR